MVNRHLKKFYRVQYMGIYHSGQAFAGSIIYTSTTMPNALSITWNTKIIEDLKKVNDAREIAIQDIKRIS